MTQEALKHLKAITEAFGPDAGIELDQKAWAKLHAAIKEALAQPEQETVAYATKEYFHRELERRLKHIREEMKIKSVTMRCKDYDIALPIIDTDFGRVLVGQVSTPPQRTWVGLDHHDKKKFSSWLDHKTDDEVFTAIEARLKELNT